MPLWIPITIAAAFMQNVRSALQKSLSEQVGTSGATYARFLFAFPLAAIYLWTLTSITEQPLPSVNTPFFVNALLGGTAQILATTALVHSFGYRNFSVGTTYSKTEAIQTVLFAFLILGESVTGSGLVAIFISFIGVLALSARDGDKGIFASLRGLGQPASLYGLASGAFFGVSAVMYRGAAHALDGEPDMFLAAATTLVVVLAWQTLLMTTWLAIRSPDKLFATLRAWRQAIAIGATGVIASIGWFTAVALHNPAYVRALGQVELLFTLAASILFFHEKITRRELVGMALVIGGIILMILKG